MRLLRTGKNAREEKEREKEGFKSRRRVAQQINAGCVHIWRYHKSSLLIYIINMH
jgi:hypothetical protein